MILAWIFIPLEHPRWQRIRENIKTCIRISTPRVRVRWTRPLSHSNMLVIDRCIAQRNAEPRRRAFSGLQNIRGRYHQWRTSCLSALAIKHSILMRKKSRSFECRGAAVDPRYHRHLLAILALICVTQPFNPLAQFIFRCCFGG